MRSFSGVFVSSLFLISSSAFANPSEWLSCSTPGDALDSVSLGIQSQQDGKLSTLLVEVQSMDDTQKPQLFSSYIEDSELRHFKNHGNSHTTSILRSEKSQDFGGSTSEAGILLVNKTSNKVTAVLSIDGLVYLLNCK